MRSTSRWPCPGGTSSCAAAPEHPEHPEHTALHPSRDRSYSAPRSVEPRVEIGRTPSLRCGVRCLGAEDRMGRASPPRAGSTDACVGRGWWVLHTRVRSVSVGTAESCGTATSVAVMVLLPCAQTPLSAHGSPTTARDAHQKSLSFQQKMALDPQTLRSPMCNIEDNRTHQTHPPRRPSSRCTDSLQPASRSVRLSPANPTSRRTRRARERKPHATPQNRWRTADPRNRTDLGTGYDRSRAGTGPISTRNTTDLAK